MNYKDYVTLMSKKLKIAVAVSIIKNKPQQLTTDQYIDQIKEKINTRKADEEDLICSDDFNIDDGVFSHDLAEVIAEETSILDNNGDINIDVIDTQRGDTASVDLLQDFNDKEAAIQATGDSMPVNTIEDSRMHSLTEVLKSIRDIDQNNMEVDQDSLPFESQPVIPDSLTDLCNNNNKLSFPMQHNKTNFNFINQERHNTQFVDEKLKAKVAKNVAKQIHDIDKTNTNSNEKVLSVEINNKKLYFCNESRKEQDNNNETIIKEKAAKVLNNVLIEIERKNDIKEPPIQDINAVTEDNTYVDTQTAILYTLQGYTEPTQISQSQVENIHVGNNFIIGNKNINYTNIQDMTNVKDFEKGNFAQKNSCNNEKQTDIITIDSQQIEYVIDNNGRTYAVLSTLPYNNNINNNKENEKVPMDVDTFENAENELESQASNLTKQLDDSKNISINTENKNNKENMIFEDEMNNDSSEEHVPFKVVKELSKIKTFLNKRQRSGSIDCSSDSGYRSDSQSSFRIALQSESWMHQSAYCLYSYLVQCPLSAGTEEIITEISQVLGELIDKLHEEEKYPNFLEELLDKITSLLNDVYEGNNICEDVLLEKDDTIQRLLHLNKSAHILKFTIDKITKILEKTHDDLSNENFSEIENIQEIENISYIFHLLEILIKKYMKAKENIYESQKTQNSQEKILKKSSISDIWRKKWNSNIKEIKNLGSSEKSCVLTKCGVVLNKIIVECMEGYSLISFAALQCFNLLQNQ